MAPGATARQLEIQKAKQPRSTSSRYNFVYRGDAGWVYTVRSLDVGTRQLKQLMLERQGDGVALPRAHHHRRQRELRPTRRARGG